MLEMTDKTLVVQRNNIVEARYRLTVEEQRLIKTLISQIHSNDEDFKVYQIHVHDLAALIGITDDHYYTRIKKLTKKLRDSSLCFINENGDEVQTGWLSSAVYRKGQGFVELRFDPILRPYLLQLKKYFTSYELGNILRLKGMYSIRIYELLKQDEWKGRREFTVEQFKTVLSLESEYREYRDLKKYVLAPAQKEICEKTDIDYTLTELKRGRKVIGLIFEILSKKKKKDDESKIVAIDNDSGNESQQDNKVEEQLKSFHLLLEIGVSQEMAKELIKEHTEEEILAAIAYTETLKREGKVKNPAGFLVDAIRKGFRDNHAEERKKKEEAKRKEQERLSHQEQWDQIKKAYQSAVSGEALRQYEALGEAEKKATWDTFYAAQNHISRKFIDRDHNGSPARGFLIAYLKTTLELPSFTEWAQAVGLDLSAFRAEIQWEKLV